MVIWLLWTHPEHICGQGQLQHLYWRLTLLIRFLFESALVTWTGNNTVSKVPTAGKARCLPTLTPSLCQLLPSSASNDDYLQTLFLGFSALRALPWISTYFSFFLFLSGCMNSVLSVPSNPVHRNLTSNCPCLGLLSPFSGLQHTQGSLSFFSDIKTQVFFS